MLPCFVRPASLPLLGHPVSDSEEVALSVVSWRRPEVSMFLAKRLHLESRLFIDRPGLSSRFIHRSCNILQLWKLQVGACDVNLD